jgi:magnesium chelatase subunit I
MWFDGGGALQVEDDVAAPAVVEGFKTVPALLGLVELTGLAEKRDAPVVAAACELILESLVARRKISRSDAGLYGRSHEEKRRRPYQE